MSSSYESQVYSIEDLWKASRESIKFYPPIDSVKDYLRDVVYFVRATPDEIQGLMRRYDFEEKEKALSSKNWKLQSQGCAFNIGTILDRPVAIHIRACTIWGSKKIIFFEGFGSLVDYELVDNWLDTYVPGIWKNGRRRVTTAGSGHLAIEEVFE